MKYSRVIEGVFLERPNRFIARVGIKGKTETVHVKNTGRCRELLQPGTRVYLEEADRPGRKTKYDLIAAEKLRKGLPSLLINMDSQAPNQAAEEWLKQGTLFSKQAQIRREVKYKNSRFDFYIQEGKRRIFLEVKGVTLEQEGRVVMVNSTMEALRQAQEAFAGEAARMGLHDEEDVVRMMREFRKERCDAGDA